MTLLENNFRDASDIEVYTYHDDEDYALSDEEEEQKEDLSPVNYCSEKLSCGNCMNCLGLTWRDF